MNWRSKVRTADEQGWARRVKRLLPPWFFRILTILFTLAMGLVPSRLRYALVGFFLRRQAPYRLVGALDTVIQVGCARDILLSGRSRSLHWARLVPKGVVVVVEPDKENCLALTEMVRRHGITNLRLVSMGAWKSKGSMDLLGNRAHPASGLLEEVFDKRDSAYAIDSYTAVTIEVDSLDAIVAGLPIPKPTMISITTNGAEPEVVAGARGLLESGCRYVSLAETVPGLEELMDGLGYKVIAKDDRGFTFERRVENT